MNEKVVYKSEFLRVCESHLSILKNSVTFKKINIEDIESIDLKLTSYYSNNKIIFVFGILIGLFVVVAVLYYLKLFFNDDAILEGLLFYYGAATLIPFFIILSYISIKNSMKKTFCLFIQLKTSSFKVKLDNANRDEKDILKQFFEKHKIEFIEDYLG